MSTLVGKQPWQFIRRSVCTSSWKALTGFWISVHPLRSGMNPMPLMVNAVLILKAQAVPVVATLRCIVSVVFDLLIVIGFVLIFSSAPMVGVGCLVVAGIVWLWLCPDAYDHDYENNED